MKPPIKNGTIKIDDGIEYVAAVALPQLSRRDAKKRVRARVVKAYQDGVFGGASYSRIRMENAVEFFGWARRLKGWELLLAEEGLPPLYGDAKANLTGRSSITASAFVVPATIEEAVTRLMECEQELAECNRERRDRQPDLDELAERRRKQEKQKTDGHRHGKHGGRGNRK